MSKTPFFIIANPRSGSTLLRLMLTSHPNICVPPECGWVACKYKNYQEGIDYDKFIDDFFDPSTKKVETWDLTPAEVLEALQRNSPNTYPELVDTVYRLYIDKHQPGKKIWGDKNNFYVNHIPDLLEIFPNAKYISLIRDGRDVAVSYKDMRQYKQKYAPRVPSDPAVAFEEWADTLEKVYTELSGTDFITVRYETLVQAPEQELNRICEFLGQPYSYEMLSYHKNDYESQETLAWKMKTKEPPSTSQVGRWKSAFTRNEKEKIQTIIKNKPYTKYFLYEGKS